MAWQIMAWVLDNPNVRGNLKLVALALANYANDKGIAWPSVGKPWPKKRASVDAKFNEFCRRLKKSD